MLTQFEAVLMRTGDRNATTMAFDAKTNVTVFQPRFVLQFGPRQQTTLSIKKTTHFELLKRPNITRQSTAKMAAMTPEKEDFDGPQTFILRVPHTLLFNKT